MKAEQSNVAGFSSLQACLGCRVRPLNRPSEGLLCESNITAESKRNGQFHGYRHFKEVVRKDSGPQGKTYKEKNKHQHISKSASIVALKAFKKYTQVLLVKLYATKSASLSAVMRDDP